MKNAALSHVAIVGVLTLFCLQCTAQQDPAELTSVGGLRFNIGTHTVTVEALDNQPLVRNWCSESFNFNCYDKDKLHTLRQQEKLDEVISAPAADSEFQRQLLLMNWTFKRMPNFGSPTKRGVENKPLEILAAVDEGHRYNCMYYADVCIAALQSCGFVARSIGLKGAKSDGNGSGHALLEVWSNQYRKWILLDPLLNVYFTNNSGIPLNAYEVRQSWFYAKGEGLNIMIGPEGVKKTVADMPIARGTHEGFGTLKIRPESLGKFMYIAWEPELPNGAPDYGRMFIFKDSLCEGVPFHTRRCPKMPDEPYFPVQQASLSLSPAETRLAMKVETLTLTPDFDHFEQRVDAGQWQPCEANFEWPLHKGDNSLEVRSVNKFKLPGSASRVVLNVE